MESPAPEGVDLCGLAKAWGDDARVREPLLKTGSLFIWPCKKTTGIASFASLALNHASIGHLLDFWCCQTPTAKSIYIEHAKAEATVGSCRVSESMCVCALCVAFKL